MKLFWETGLQVGVGMVCYFGGELISDSYFVGWVSGVVAIGLGRWIWGPKGPFA